MRVNFSGVENLHCEQRQEVISAPPGSCVSVDVNLFDPFFGVHDFDYCPRWADFRCESRFGHVNNSQARWKRRGSDTGHQGIARGDSIQRVRHAAAEMGGLSKQAWRLERELTREWDEYRWIERC
jgi:hypothetical protein